MKKAIMISAEQYDKIIKHYDNLIKELKAVRSQFSVLQTQGHILNSLESGQESEEYSELEDCLRFTQTILITIRQGWAVIIQRKFGKIWIGLTSNQTITQGS